MGSQRISEEQVRHIGMLSRLKLSDEEVARFTRDLEAILEYMDDLRQVNVEGVEPTAHAVELHDAFRADEVQPSLPPDEALANAPQREGTMFKVPKVLDQDSA